VSEVSAAVGTDDLGAGHEHGSILVTDDSAWDGIVECRPAAPGVAATSASDQRYGWTTSRPGLQFGLGGV
jgi:hypothetical protein